MAELTPRFSSNRSLQEYIEAYYLKAADRFRARARNNGAWGRQFHLWKKDLLAKWKGLYFENMGWETKDGRHKCRVQVFLNGIRPEEIVVRRQNDGASERDRDLHLFTRR